MWTPALGRVLEEIMKKCILALLTVLGLSSFVFSKEFTFDNSDTHDYIFIKNETDVKIWIHS